MTRGTHPLVSIVIPAYNASPFIERTLASAFCQTYDNLEVLIVNDGSTDNTLALASRLCTGDDRARILSISNGGVANARNIGVHEATGDFIAFLDADDLWHPTKIELQVRSLLNGSGVGAAASYALMRVIDTEDRVIGKEGKIAGNGYTFARHLYAKPVGNGSSLLVHREVVLTVGGFEPSWAALGLGGCEDLDFELKICAKYPIVAVPRYLVGYRVSPGNMSSNGLRMARAVLAVVEHHIRLNPELPPWAARKVRDSTREYALTLLAGERRWNLVASELAKLLPSDRSRAVEFTARLGVRKLRKTLRGRRTTLIQEIGAPHFLELSPESIPLLSGGAVRARDRRNLDRLARVDQVLARKRGSPQDGIASAAVEAAPPLQS